jgi:hypothetical protein
VTHCTKMAHHHLGLSYADYFAAGGGESVVVPEVDAGDGGGDHHHIYGVQQPETDAFGVRGLVPVPVEVAAAKAALGGGHFADLGEHAHHRQPGHHHATLTSLSLHGPAAEAASSLAVHQQQLGGGAHWHQAWQQQQQGTWYLRGSRFLLPTQQLLQEFCSFPVETIGPKPPSRNPANEKEGSGGSSSSAPSSVRIQAMDAAELQRLKAKLYAMLDEVSL